MAQRLFRSVVAVLILGAASVSVAEPDRSNRGLRRVQDW